MGMMGKLTTLLGLVALVRGECMLQEQENNFLASRLEGNWTFNPTMSLLLTGDSNAGGFLGQMVVGFSNQPEVLEEVPEESGFEIFMAGLVRFYHIEFGVMSHTYVLTSEHGIPVFIYWSTGPNDSLTPVTNYLSMAPAQERRNDLLFLGGQKADQEFSALQRIEREFMLVVEDNTPRQ